MIDNNDKARALSRVKKMMALANDSAASEGERDNALRMAHATLAKWNLSMAEALKSNPNATAEENRSHDKHAATIRDQPWARRVAAAVGSMMFCECYFIRQGKGKVAMYFVGLDTNAAAAAELAMRVVKSIMSEANSKWKLQADPGPWWTNFCKGAADTVSERCKDLRKFGGYTEGTALVLANHFENERKTNLALMNSKLRLRTDKGREHGSLGDGYIAGRTFGKGVEINRSIQ
jgi:hypothetical protein